jgi:hypothetical protein
MKGMEIVGTPIDIKSSLREDRAIRFCDKI